MYQQGIKNQLHYENKTSFKNSFRTNYWFKQNKHSTKYDIYAQFMMIIMVLI